MIPENIKRLAMNKRIKRLEDYQPADVYERNEMEQLAEHLRKLSCQLDKLLGCPQLPAQVITDVKCDENGNVTVETARVERKKRKKAG